MSERSTQRTRSTRQGLCTSRAVRRQGAPLVGWRCLTPTTYTKERLMECTPAPAAPATPALRVSPPGLLAAFAAVPDPRRQASIDYPLPALLALAVTALLANQQSPLAIAQWAARQGRRCCGRSGSVAGGPRTSRRSSGSSALAAGALSAALGADFAPPPRPPRAAGQPGGGDRRQGPARAAVATGGRRDRPRPDRLLPRAGRGPRPGGDPQQRRKPRPS